MLICTDASSYTLFHMLVWMCCCCTYLSSFQNRSLSVSVVEEWSGMGDSAPRCLRQTPRSSQEGSAATGAVLCGLVHGLAVCQGGTGLGGIHSRGRVKKPFSHSFCESLCKSGGGVALLSLSHCTVMGYCNVCVPVLPMSNTHSIC